MIPAGACKYLMFLWIALANTWIDFPDPAIMAGLVEQETCISMKHKDCWNPKAEMKTYREYGFGLGQTTIAYNKDGSERFNVWKDLRSKYKKELKNWTWENRYDPESQLRSMILLNRQNWPALKKAKTVNDRIAFMLSVYNGGSLVKDFAYCNAIPGCDSGRWFGHIEIHSVKSKKEMKGYGGRSPYQINREYVKNIMKIRTSKYRKYVPEDFIPLVDLDMKNAYNMCH